MMIVSPLSRRKYFYASVISDFNLLNTRPSLLSLLFLSCCLVCSLKRCHIAFATSSRHPLLLFLELISVRRTKPVEQHLCSLHPGLREHVFPVLKHSFTLAPETVGHLVAGIRGTLLSLLDSFSIQRKLHSSHLRTRVKP